MVKLPVLSGEKVVKVFKNAGWIVARQKGSHIIMIKKGHIASLSIPRHKEIAPGTLRALIRNSGMTVEEFMKILI